MSPVKYDISNVYDSATPCTYCGGSGYQHIGGIGYRACQYCITGYKVRHCESCHGAGCPSCVGTLHSFYSEIAPAGPAPVPDTSARPYAGEATPQPPRILPRR